MTYTYTRVRLFDTEKVDKMCSDLYSELETDYLSRQAHISPKNRTAIESRLSFLRAVWTLLLDEASE